MTLEVDFNATTSGDSPIINLVSGVKLSALHITLSISASTNLGTLATKFFIKGS